MKIERIEFLLTAFLLSMMMTFIVSAISTLISIGLQEGFLFLWLKAWGSSWLVAFPSVVFVLPLVRRMVHKLVLKIEGKYQ